MARWRTTKSGYRYEVISKAQHLKELGGDIDAHPCPHDDCPVITQGGTKGLTAHLDQIHGGEKKPCT